MTRENQGLQIALIIFVLLTVLLGVTTFYFFRQYDEAQLKAKAAETAKMTADGEAKRVQDEANELKRLIGFAETEKLDAITTAATQDMEVYAKTYPEPSKPYRKVLEYLAGQLRKAGDDLATAKNANEALNRKLESREKAKEPQVVKFREAAQKASEDLLAEANKFKEQTESMVEEKKKMAEDFQDKRKSLEDNLSKVAANETILRRKVEDQSKDVVAVHHKLNEIQRETFTTPSGAVRYVNQATGTVWINLGRSDALNLQTSFSVYPSDSSDMKKAAKKGSIEVTEILGDHLAAARVTKDEMNEPILPGDKIYTPIWSPGERRHFALAGFIDIDGDGRSDLDYVRNLITMNGGIVDAYIDEKAKDMPMVGAVTSNTRYLVMGAAPTETKGDSPKLKAFSKIVGTADALGVEHISVQNLLDMMGSPGPAKVVHYGTGASPQDLRAEQAKEAQPVSNGSVTDLFKPRHPSEHNSVY